MYAISKIICNSDLNWNVSHAPKLHLFDQKYRTIVKYYYNLK